MAEPQRWWHWVLLYPTLVTTCVASIPTITQYIRAIKLNTSPEQVQLVEEQQRLWYRNVACLSKHLVYSVDGPEGLVVGVTLCDTGDALLRYHYPKAEPIYRWIAAPTQDRYPARETFEYPH